jgi:hypothetical protein
MTPKNAIYHMLFLAWHGNQSLKATLFVCELIIAERTTFRPLSLDKINIDYGKLFFTIAYFTIQMLVQECVIGS